MIHDISEMEGQKWSTAPPVPFFEWNATPMDNDDGVESPTVPAFSKKAGTP